jgi:predicted lipoprotein with Yx(FWY)xxD motif
MRTAITAGIAGVILLAGAASAGSAEKAGAVASTTPPGVTLVDVTLYISNSSEQFLWRRLGDADGKPLYTYDKDPKGAATCVDDCAKEFTPFLADAKAIPANDWTLITRTDGAKQWAYQGAALYRYAGTDPAGQPTGGNLSSEDPAWLDPGSKMYAPKSGWRRAAFEPAKTLAMPGEVELKSLGVANGYGFVSANTGMVAYVLKGPPKNQSDWTPVYAPAAASPIGDFTIMMTETGKRQWAYKGSPLYTYNGDYSDTDVNGVLAEKDAQPALAYRNFMPNELRVGIFNIRGPLMTTQKGMTVYTETRYHLQYGGRRTREGFRYLYADAKGVGTRGCIDDCLKDWTPVAAPANAVSSGFWEVATRDNGTKQWLYKGAPIYTFAGDKKPGDIEGNNRSIVMYGDADGKIDLSPTGGDKPNGRNHTGAGYYWHIAGLLNY